MISSCDQFVFGESPDPANTGFKTLGYSAGLTEAELSFLERSANVGEWLARSVNEGAYYAYHPLPSGRVAFSVRVTGSPHGERTGAAANPILCHAYVLSPDEFIQLGNPFARFSRTSPVRYLQASRCFGELWNPANHRTRRLGELNTLEIDTDDAPADVGEGIKIFGKRLLASMGADGLCQRCAVAYDLWLRGTRCVFPQSARQALEDLACFLWLSLPPDDRLHVAFSTHVIPIRWAEYGFCNVPDVYQHEIDARTPFEVLDDHAVLEQARPIDPIAKVFAHLIVDQPALHTTLLEEWGSLRRSWRNNPAGLEPYLAKRGAMLLDPSKVPQYIRGAIVHNRLKPGERAEELHAWIGSALKAGGDRPLLKDLADVAVLLVDTMDITTRRDALRELVAELPPDSRSIVLAHWLELESTRGWLQALMSELLGRSEVAVIMADPAAATQLLARTNTSKNAPEAQAPTRNIAADLITSCKTKELELLLKDWDFDEDTLDALVRECQNHHAAKVRQGLLATIFASAMRTRSALTKLTAPDYLKRQPLETLHIFLKTAAASAVFPDNARAPVAAALLQYVTPIQPTPAPRINTGRKQQAQASIDLEQARAAFSRLLTPEGDAHAASVIRDAPERADVIPGLWLRSIEDGLLAPATTPTSCRALVDRGDRESLKRLVRSLVSVAATRKSAELSTLAKDILRHDDACEWVDGLDPQVQARGIARLLVANAWPRHLVAPWCARLIALGALIAADNVPHLPWLDLDRLYPGTCASLVSGMNTIGHVDGLLRTGVPSVVIIVCREAPPLDRREAHTRITILSNLLQTVDGRRFEHLLLRRHVDHLSSFR
jgi:hypothetical protein